MTLPNNYTDEELDAYVDDFKDRDADDSVFDDEIPEEAEVA